LLGTDGAIGMDDFVGDWTDSVAFQNPDIKTGYWYKTGLATRKDAVFVETPADTAAQVAMMENFAALAASGDLAARTAFAEASVKTQELVDAIWEAAGN